MAQLDGKQLKELSVSLNKLNGSGVVQFSSATMSFQSGSKLQVDYTINSPEDVVNKNYVDAVASGLDAKSPVSVVSATGPISLSGINFQIDGFTISAFDRVLVAAQAGPNVATNSNGIYIATSSAWYRADDSDGSPLNEVSHGNFVFVLDGAIYEHTGWVLTGTDAANPDEILVGTNSQLWVQFSEQANIRAGNGLSYQGQTLNVGAGTGITVGADDVSITNTTVTAGNYGTAGSVATFTVNAQGQLVGATSVSININSGQINDFSTAVDTVIFNSDNFVDGSTIDFSVIGATGVTAEVSINSLTASRLNSVNTPTQGYVLGYTASGQFYWYDPTLVGDITEVVAGGGLTGGGNSGVVNLSLELTSQKGLTFSSAGDSGTLEVSLKQNGGLTFSLDGGLEAVVDGVTVFIVDGVIKGAAQGVLGVTAGSGLIGGGSSSYITLDINAGLGLTTSSVNDTVEMIWGGTSSGLTFSNNSIAANVDGTTIAINNSGQLTVIAGASQPVYDRFTASITSGNAAVVTGVTLTSTPNDYSRVQVYVNGQLQRLASGATNLDCYFDVSGKTINSLVAGDQLYWNGTNAGFDLTTTDVVEIIYES